MFVCEAFDFVVPKLGDNVSFPRIAEVEYFFVLNYFPSSDIGNYLSNYYQVDIESL
jgi:hypothetical protein